MNIEKIGQDARQAAYKLAILSKEQKTSILNRLAQGFRDKESLIISANQKDLERAQASGLSKALIDRLELNSARLAQAIQSIHDIIELEDPIGETIENWTLYNGIKARKVRVPIGVVGIIYEARPNVTIDAAVICLKTGNAAILKGSATALNTNVCLVNIIRDVLERMDLDKNFVQIIDSPARDSIDGLLKLNRFVDVIIPRGGIDLINYVVQNSSVPVIETGAGNCHVFLDSSAKLDMAIQIILNAKTQRPSVCNAAETLLWHKDLSGDFISAIGNALRNAGVTINGCQQTTRSFTGCYDAHEDDWHKEYLDYTIAMKCVNSLQDAIDHINKYGTRHSEAIITNSQTNAETFINKVDAAAVYWNASTRFTDGGQFGFGAEIGISTQKLHARGPMGLKELCSYKYVLKGNGQIRS